MSDSLLWASVDFGARSKSRTSASDPTLGLIEGLGRKLRSGRAECVYLRAVYMRGQAPAPPGARYRSLLRNELSLRPIVDRRRLTFAALRQTMSCRRAIRRDGTRGTHPGFAGALAGDTPTFD